MSLRSACAGKFDKPQNHFLSVFYLFIYFFRLIEFLVPLAKMLFFTLSVTFYFNSLYKKNLLFVEVFFHATTSENPNHAR